MGVDCTWIDRGLVEIDDFCTLGRADGNRDNRIAIDDDVLARQKASLSENVVSGVGNELRTPPSILDDFTLSRHRQNLARNGGAHRCQPPERRIVHFLSFQRSVAAQGHYSKSRLPGQGERT